MAFTSAIDAALSALKQLAGLPDFWSLMSIAYGDSFDVSVLEALRSQWLEVDQALLPRIELTKAETLNGASGAFVSGTQTILVAQEFVATASDETIKRVLLEEYGHFVDQKINSTDSNGDEGGIFAEIAINGSISEARLAALRTRDDHGTISINQTSLAVEFASDAIAPTLAGGVSAVVPALASAGSGSAVDISSDLQINFSEAIQRGSSGSIKLYRADGTLIETFAVPSSSRLNVSGSTITLNPSFDLDGNSSYYVLLDPGSVEDLAGNAFAGVSERTSLSFQTGYETTFSLGDSFQNDQFPGNTSYVIGDMRVLYIRATYTDVNRATTSLADAEADMEAASQGWISTSKGRMPVSYTYTPTVTLPFSHEWMMTYDQTTNGLGLVHTAARVEAAKLGYDEANYDMLVVRFDTALRDGASFGGGGAVWLAWGGEGVMLHEGGHAMGLGHSNSINLSGVNLE